MYLKALPSLISINFNEYIHIYLHDQFVTPWSSGCDNMQVILIKHPVMRKGLCMKMTIHPSTPVSEILSIIKLHLETLRQSLPLRSINPAVTSKIESEASQALLEATQLLNEKMAEKR